MHKYIITVSFLVILCKEICRYLTTLFVLIDKLKTRHIAVAGCCSYGSSHA